MESLPAWLVLQLVSFLCTSQIYHIVNLALAVELIVGIIDPSHVDL